VDDFFDGVGAEISAWWTTLVIIHVFNQLKLLLFHSQLLFGGLFIVSLLLLLFLGLLLFLFFSCVTLNLLLKG
jgi:hypothetical protein